MLGCANPEPVRCSFGGSLITTTDFEAGDYFAAAG
jgi:hypothetical protein